MFISSLFLFTRRKSHSFPKPKAEAGFSLLELMVVFSLTTILSGGGFFAFTKYSQSQEFNQGIAALSLTYDLARNSSISNVKPESECSSSDLSTSVLEGYRVDLYEDKIELVTDCSATDVSKTQPLPASVKIRNAQRCSGILYKPVSGNVLNTQGSLPCNFELYHEADSENLVRQVEITPDGRLTIQ
jgi:Tfp pilus assembly protein FimT